MTDPGCPQPARPCSAPGRAAGPGPAASTGTVRLLAALDPPPAGFPACSGCAYLRSGPPALCLTCATAGVEPHAGPRCPSCGQPLTAGQPCPNTVCGLPERWFSRIYTVCEDPEPMWEAIYSYKHREGRDWAELFGRLLVGFLDERGGDLARFDTITTGALYVGPRAARLWDYLRLVVEAAQRQGLRWTVEPGLIDKSGPTGRFMGLGVEERRAIAEGELRQALSVPEPERVAGRRVLVFDDVYSEGYSMREMARALVLAGAEEAAGLVLTRRKGG